MQENLNKRHFNFKHGRSSKPGNRDPLHDTWRSLRNRCNNTKNAQYKDYGARGISVCKEWDDFSVFVSDMGERPEGTSIDRMDNNGNYCKENCRWSTIKEQNNNKRSTRIHEIKEKKVTHQQLLKDLCLSKQQYRNIENKEQYKSKGLKKRQRKGTFNWVHSASRNKDNPLHSLYKSWGYMKYHKDGIHEDWESFDKLVNDLGPRPEGKKLLRRDTKAMFCKDNCYWG